MTGNTVLLALAVVQGHGADAARSGVAFAGFVTGVAVTALLPRHRLAFLLQVALLAAIPVVALAAGRFPLVAMAAAAMGSQSAATRHHTPPGVNVTYLTGTTTSAVLRWVGRALGRREEDPRLPSGIWLLYFAGALAGGAMGVAFGRPAFGAAAGVTLAVALSVR